MAKGGFAQAVADGINGYLRGYMAKRGMDKEDADRAFQDEQRTNMRTDRARADALQGNLESAARPVSVTEGAGGMTAPTSTDNIDVGQPGNPGLAEGGLSPGVRVGDRGFADTGTAKAYADTQNTPDAIAARQVAAYRAAGKPIEAQQLDTSGTQGKLAKFELDEKQTAFVNKKFDTRLASISSPEDLAGVLSGSPLSNGRKVTSAPSPDGKTVDLIAHNDDGSTVKMNQKPIPNTAEGVKKAIVTYSQGMSAAEKIGALQHFDTFEESKRQFEVNKGLQLKQIGISAGHLDVSRKELALHERKLDEDLKNDPTHNLPGAVKIRSQSLEKGITGIEAAINKAATDPGYDPNAPGIRDLVQRKTRMEGERNELLKPYIGDTGGKADYMGFGGKPAPAKPGTIGAAPAGSVRNTGAGWSAAPAGGMATQGLPAATAGTSQPAQNAGPQAGANPLLAAMGGATGNASIDNAIAQSAPAIQQAGEAVRAAQAQVVAASKSGDTSAVQNYMRQAQAAGQQLEAMLKDMQPEQAQRVKQALGV